MSDVTTVTRLYGGFRGVDFRGEECDLSRSPDSVNMWRDYRQIQRICTRPAMELVLETAQRDESGALLGDVNGDGYLDTRDARLLMRYVAGLESGESLNLALADFNGDGRINARDARAMLEAAAENAVYGIYSYSGQMIVHKGSRLLAYMEGELVASFEGTGWRKSNAFVFGETWYFVDGVNYLSYDGRQFSPVEGYVPTTSIGRKPEGGGSTYEDVNMLTARRKNSFLSDGESIDYYLDAQNIDADFWPVVTVDGVTVDSDGYQVDFEKGFVTFREAPAAPQTAGQDNVLIEFQKTVEGYRERITGCSLLQLFDNRVFFSGNPAYPNMLWHCSLNDPSYVSDLDYYREGMDNAAVRSLVAGNNALWVFREPSDENTTVFYHVPTPDDTYGKVYPASHSSVATGCVGRAINFRDDIVFFSDKGMEGISGDITTEQVVAHRSSLADRKLTESEAYPDMVLAEWEGYLLVFIEDECFVADSRSVFANEGHMEYDWYYWKMERPVTCANVHEGVLYLGTVAGVYSLTGRNAPLESHWVTPKDKFQYPNRLKTTNKRGCVMEAGGSFRLLAKKGSGAFEQVGSFDAVTDYCVARMKQKKCKDLQLKFQTDSRFSLETVTLEVFVGGYIKR